MVLRVILFLPQYMHFEGFLVKKDGWKMMMEYQEAQATREEWDSSGQGKSLELLALSLGSARFPFEKLVSIPQRMCSSLQASPPESGGLRARHSPLRSLHA